MFTASTQLVTNEDTTGVSDSFFETYHFDYENFCNTYTIEKVKIPSTYDGISYLQTISMHLKQKSAKITGRSY